MPNIQKGKIKNFLSFHAKTKLKIKCSSHRRMNVGIFQRHFCNFFLCCKCFVKSLLKISAAYFSQARLN